MLSRRAKEAIKTGLAVVFAYAIAMWMGWDKPMWAALTVVTVNLLSTGVSLQRGILRTFGTALGCLAGLALIGMFPQERWWYLLSGSLFFGFCIYMMTGKKHSYTWFLCGMTFLIIMPISSPLESEEFFHIAMTRTLETAMGAVVYTIVAVFLWPQSSVGTLESASRMLFSIQAGLFRTYRGLMVGEEADQDWLPRQTQQVQLSGLLSTLLDGAETDSYEVWEARGRWRQFRDQSTELMLALERWRLSFPEVQGLDLKKLLPNLEAVCDELDMRFATITGMLGGEAPERTARAITVGIDESELRALTHFQQAAVTVTKSNLDALESLSRSLFDCVREIKGHGVPQAAPAREAPRTRQLTIDADRLRAAVNGMATLWVAFLLWVYFDPPGHAVFPMMAGIFALIIAYVPGVGATAMFLSWGVGAVFAGTLNVFVMPHLSGFAELAVMIFAAFVAMYCVLGELRQTPVRMFCMASFLILIGIENQQSYSFTQLANSAAWLLLALAVAVAVTYIPPSPCPEKVFLRLLSRFFRNSEFLLTRLAAGRDQRSGMLGRWKAALYSEDLIGLTQKLAAVGRQISSHRFLDTPPEQVQALVTSLEALAFRMKELVEVRDRINDNLVARELLEDLRAWRLAIIDQFHLRAVDPGGTFLPAADLQERLAQRLAALEARVEGAIQSAEEGEFSAREYEILYYLLGSFRGLSEAGIAFREAAGDIDWGKWREARF